MLFLKVQGILNNKINIIHMLDSFPLKGKKNILIQKLTFKKHKFSTFNEYWVQEPHQIGLKNLYEMIDT